MKPILRFISRISIRLMAFNVLLVFLPVAGILYLGSYERQLVAGQARSVAEQARLLAAALSGSELQSESLQPVLDRFVTQGPARVRSEDRVRLRVLDPSGHVLADSHESTPQPPQKPSPIRRNPLYRLGSFVLRPLLRLLQTTEPVLEPGDYYENADQLMGSEVQSALRGRAESTQRITGGQRSVTLYSAAPITDGTATQGVVLASQSTFTILQDLYAVRLGVFRIFLAALVVAVILSLLVGTTIVGPLRRLRVEAREMLDKRGRLRGRFRGSRKLDEIGDLSRALERLTRRLDSHLKFIESFASDVSHEFKNPLASIRTATEMLAEVTEPGERRRFSRMVEQEIARMEQLLAGVREITLIDSHLQHERQENVAVDALLEKIVEGFRLREGTRVAFELQISGQPLVVESSEDRLIQVFENILDNAVSFSPAGGVIRIDLVREGGSVVARISDQGPGILDDNLGRIFERFFTYRPDSVRRKTGHTGLGLAIVKSIVEGYGGSVTGANRAGGGAVFEIRLPARNVPLVSAAS